MKRNPWSAPVVATNLRLDWATHAAARYACEHWHYSKCIPKSKLVKIGVWESGKFIGVVLFSNGANAQIGRPYNLTQFEICELTRIALNKHSNPVSKIVSICFKFLKKQCPKLKMVVSYADLEQGHHGGIYQATNWIYVGKTKPDCYLKIKDIVEHRKTIYDRYGTNSIVWLRKNVDPKAERIPDLGKYKYLMPLDDKMRRMIEPLRKPYPKRVVSSAVAAPTNHVGEGGSIPTTALRTLGG